MTYRSRPQLAHQNREIAKCERKRRHRSRSSALIAIHTAERTRKVKLEEYECPWCGGWHLTKKKDIRP